MLLNSSAYLVFLNPCSVVPYAKLIIPRRHLPNYLFSLVMMFKTSVTASHRNFHKLRCDYAYFILSFPGQIS
uniref:Uncharacterized protein n=1 Tax=Arundo donax TaxID=35708 RepID=A0A0A8Z736_ARUDO